MGGREGRGVLPDFLFYSFFLVQQTTSGIGHRVRYNSFFGLATQYAEYEKQQEYTECDQHEGKLVTKA